MTIGRQIRERSRRISGWLESPPGARPSCSTRWASRARSNASRTTRTSSPAACGSEAMIAMALACEPKLLIADEADDRARRHDPGADPGRAQDARPGAPDGARDDHPDLGVIAGMCERVNVMYGGLFMEPARGRSPPCRSAMPLGARCSATRRRAGAPDAGRGRRRRDMLTAPVSVRAALPVRGRAVAAVPPLVELEQVTSSRASTRSQPTSGSARGRKPPRERQRRAAGRDGGPCGLVHDQVRDRARPARGRREGGRRRLARDRAWRDARARR